jgi:hypothetical protein
MKKASLTLIVLLLILAASAVNAVPLAGKISNPMVKPSFNPQLFAPYIHVNLIKIAPAAPGNSKPVNVSVNVTSRVTQKDICGLNASNFKIDGPAYISNVFPISAVAINQPMTCDYWLSIVPNSPWVTGTNALKLDYIQGGQQLTNATLIFRV